MQCQNRTKAGKRCKAAAMKGQRTCLFHTVRNVKQAARVNRSFEKRRTKKNRRR